MTVSDNVIQEHRRKFQSLPLPWAGLRKKAKKGHDNIMPDEHTAKRAAHLPPFVLQELYSELTRQCAVHERELDNIFPDHSPGHRAPLDAHLAAPWRDAVARAEQFAQRRGNTSMKEELAAIRTHVQEVYELHRLRVKQYVAKRGRGASSKGGASFTDRPIEQRQDTFRELSRAFEAGPAALPDGEPLLCFDEAGLRRLRASYAYIYDHDESRGGWSRFPWDVAMRTLCQIKVEALGGGKTLTEDFYYKMAIPRSFVKQS